MRADIWSEDKPHFLCWVWWVFFPAYFWLFHRVFSVDSKLYPAIVLLTVSVKLPLLNTNRCAKSLTFSGGCIHLHYLLKYSSGSLLRKFLGGCLHGRSPGQHKCKHGARRGEPCPSGSWHMVLWLLTLLASAATSREPASVRLCLISCSSLSALCMRQGSDSYGNAESERTGTYHFEPVLRQVW